MTNNENIEKLTEILALLRLSGIGRGRFYALINAFGSPQKIFKASISQLAEVPRISHTIASEVHNNINFVEAKNIASKIFELGWNVHFYNDESFPKQLFTISAKEIPPVIFSIGKEISFDDKLIGIVGARHATEQGKQFAYNLAASLSRAGIVVVSGMAEGIDSAAHKGALDAGGHTVAVWGSSLDIVYPPSNKMLAELIKKNGTVFSEYLPGTAPMKNYFPQRNRIIAGFSDGIVVVEAGKKSGALITAEIGLSYEKQIFAMPGLPSSKMSIGTNQLIKSGARLITSIDDIYEELPLLKGEIAAKQFVRLPDMTDIEKKIVHLFSDGPKQVDNISREVSLAVPELMEFLLALELKGIVKELSGKRFMLSEEYV